MAQTSGNDPESQGLCLLSLDGGGVKGLSSLLILRRLMENISQTDPPKPCEYFDMICGTSTGGLIAIMPGRLRLSVNECIKEYRKLSPLIFVKKRHRFTFKGSIQGRLDHGAFEQAVCEMLGRYGFTKDALFKEQENPPCKVFVCATSLAHKGGSILSNYYSIRRDSELWNNAKIWEVARVTSAAPTLFDPITISHERFGDGALRANNPVKELEGEVRDVWGGRANTWNFELNTHCLVSIGTGKLALESFKQTMIGLQFFKSLTDILTDTEETADHFQRVHTAIFQNGCAFRFNVDQGMEKIKLEEVEEIGNVEVMTRKYIGKEDIFVAIGRCAQQLDTRGLVKIPSLAQRHISRVSKQLEPTQIALDLFSSCSHTSEYVAWRREGTILVYDQVKSGLKAEHNRKSAACIATGLIDNGDPRSGHEPRIYYFDCQPQSRVGGRPGEENISAAKYPARFDDILRSMTLQVLAKENEALLNRYLATTEGKTTLQPIFRPNTVVDYESLKRNFISLLLKTQATPSIIVIDNLDDVEEGRGVQLIRELAHQFQVLDVPIKFVISISSLRQGTFGGLQVYCVWDGLEYLGLSILPFVYIEVLTYFEECEKILGRKLQGNQRREGISDAEPKTVDWIWVHQSYKSWESMSRGILWIEGKPGSGKSVLAKSVSNSHRKMLEAEQDRRRQDRGERFTSESSPMLLSDWYYSTRGNATAQNHRFLFQALLFQWLEQNPAIFPLFFLEYRQHEPLSESWINVRSLRKIVRTIVQQGIPILSIVDAMDESENSQDSEIQRADILRSFLEMVAEIPQSKAKFIVLSRSTPEIENQLLRRRWQGFVYRIRMQDNNFEAISRIVGAGMRHLHRQMESFSGEDPYDSDANSPEEAHRNASYQSRITTADSERYERIRKYLLDNADGVILWVTLVIETLQASIETGEDNFTKLEEKLYSLPQNLSDLYKQIREDLCNKLPQETIKQARQTLMWVSRANSAGPISLGALYEAVRISPLTSTNSQDGLDDIFGDMMQFGDWNAFRARLRSRCGPFLDVSIKEKTRGGQGYVRKTFNSIDTVQLLHRTVKDFLASPEDAALFHFTDDAATRAVDEDIACYPTFLKRDFERSVRDKGVGTYLERRREAIDEVLKFFERRKLLPFLLESKKLSSDAFSQCAHYIFSRLSPLTSELDTSEGSPRNSQNGSLMKESLLERFDLSNAEDVGEFFATLIQNRSIRFGTSPIYVKISGQPCWEEKYLLELIFAELTYQAYINGLPNAASILVNLWFPKDDGPTYLAQQRSARRYTLATVAFLVSLQHGPTAICHRMWRILDGPCIDWVCGLWHVRQKRYPGIPFSISLAEKLAIESGHVEIIADLTSQLWRCRYHDTEILEKRLEADRARQRQLSPILLSAFVLVFFGPLILVLWLMQYLLGGSLLRYQPLTSQESRRNNTENGLRQNLMIDSFDHSFDHVNIQQKPSATPTAFKRDDELEMMTTMLKEKAVEVRQRKMTDQENAIRDEMVPSSSVMEALTIVTKHDVLRTIGDLPFKLALKRRGEPKKKRESA